MHRYVQATVQHAVPTRPSLLLGVVFARDAGAFDRDSNYEWSGGNGMPANTPTSSPSSWRLKQAPASPLIHSPIRNALLAVPAFFGHRAAKGGEVSAQLTGNSGQ